MIQQECLAIIYALKQFRLGRQFTLLTDHAPLQWLAGQKMEGLLARWALATQEYDLIISYRKGIVNSNADALSRKQNYTNEQCAATLCLPQLLPDLQQRQTNDPIIVQLCDELQSGTSPHGRKWHRQPLRRYKQLWSVTLQVVPRHNWSPGPSMANFVAIDGPPGPTMAAMDSLLCHKWSPHEPSTGLGGSVYVLPKRLN